MRECHVMAAAVADLLRSDAAARRRPVDPRPDAAGRGPLGETVLRSSLPRAASRPRPRPPAPDAYFGGARHRAEIWRSPRGASRSEALATADGTREASSLHKRAPTRNTCCVLDAVSGRPTSRSVHHAINAPLVGLRSGAPVVDPRPASRARRCSAGSSVNYLRRLTAGPARRVASSASRAAALLVSGRRRQRACELAVPYRTDLHVWSNCSSADRGRVRVAGDVRPGAGRSSALRSALARSRRR
jgi:hypothetical protein